MNKFFCEGKKTFDIQFTQPPLRVEIYNDEGKVYFFRELGGKFKKISVNICHKGFYRVSEDCDSIQKRELEKSTINAVLPPPDRDRMKPFVIVHNENLTSTPARNFTNKGVIETGKTFKHFPFPIRLFILCHEVGHFFYADEENADLYACKIFLENGYNKSTALYALTKVLKANIQNKKRVERLFSILKS